MNNFNNIHTNTADSAWKYNFGDGFSRVHVEFRGDVCHIQLVKQTVWESIANIFLGFFNKELIKPHITEDRIISYPQEEREVDQKIQAIRDKIFQLQNNGDSPSTIKDKLFEAENDLAKAAQSLIQIQNTQKKTDFYIQHNRSKDEDPSPESSTEQQESEASAELQPSTKQDNPSLHEITLPVDSDSFDLESENEILDRLTDLANPLKTAVPENKNELVNIIQEDEKTEDTSPESSTEQQESDAFAEQQPSTKQDNPSPHEIPLPVDSDSFDLESENEILEKLTDLANSLKTVVPENKNDELGNISQEDEKSEDTSPENSTEQQESDAFTEQQSGAKQDNPSPHEIPLPLDSDSFDFESEEELLDKLSDDTVLPKNSNDLASISEEEEEQTKISADSSTQSLEDKTESIEDINTEEIDDIDTESTEDISTEDIEDIDKNQVIDLTHSQNLPDTDSRIKTFMKYAGYGILIVGGITIGVAASILLSGGMAIFLPRGANGPAELQLRNYDNKLLTVNNLEGLNLDLYQACESLKATRQSLISSDRCVELYVDMDLMQNSLTADSSDSNIEQLAKRIEMARNDIETLKLTSVNLTAVPSLDTPLTALCETIPMIPLSEEQFIKFISQSFSGRMPRNPLEEQIEPLLGPDADYMCESLKLLGSNPEQKQIAFSLEKSLSSISPIEKQLNAFSTTFKKDFIHYMDERQKVSEEQAFLTGQEQPDALVLKQMQEHEIEVDQLEKDLINSWNIGISNAKAYISNLFLNSIENGFFLPVSTKRELLQFIPEKSINPFANAQTWTIRRYHSNSLQDGNYRPYDEIQGVTENTILFKDELIAELALSQGSLSSSLHSSQLLALLPEIKTDTLDKLFAKTKPTAFSNVHDFPLRAQSPLNNLLFVELGPEAYLDFHISITKHFIDKNADLLISNPTLNALVRNS
ncbi:MAG TPA: hypothetical protein VGP47_05525, partial [Parachlamydiaceae bacterium]|nr:hypothetical protein [Parachlamydiaceae bacterium]